MDSLSIILGGLFGFLIKVLYDELKTPKLRIGDVDGPWGITEPNPEPHFAPKIYRAYRVRVYNEEKCLLNMAAKNCVAWLDLENAKEPYQLCWVGGASSLTINVGDYREVDLCARDVGSGRIVAPTERGYFNPEPRILGSGDNALRGHLRVTCENGKKTQKSIVIEPTNHNQLKITYENLNKNAGEG